MIAILLGFTLGGILPTIALRRYLRRRRLSIHRLVSSRLRLLCDALAYPMAPGHHIELSDHSTNTVAILVRCKDRLDADSLINGAKLAAVRAANALMTPEKLNALVSATREVRSKTCGRCAGYGWTPNFPTACPACAGTGRSAS